MWKHLTIETFLGFRKNHVSTFLSPLIKVSSHCTLPPKLQALTQLQLPHMKHTGPSLCICSSRGVSRVMEIWGFAELNAVSELLCSHAPTPRWAAEPNRRKQEAGGRIAANVIPLQEYFPTHSTCSHPAGKVWEISEGGQRRVNLISLCSSASANCRREGRV